MFLVRNICCENHLLIKGIKNLAELRGNQVGCNMAEAFEVIRKIEH